MASEQEISAPVRVGDVLPEMVLPAVDRALLCRFAGASGDLNPIHIDIDFARRAGMPDVFAHGMLGMAWLGRLLTEWRPQASLRSFSVRFMALTHLGNQPVLRGQVVGLLEVDGRPLARVAVEMLNQYGQLKIQGEALVALD
ncbi:MAG: hypothetical protein JNK92_12225 [Dechloromonas sp.]|nr:hypothetical protein [Dechloromonas sp.]